MEVEAHLINLIPNKTKLHRKQKNEEEKAPVDLAGTWKSEDNDGSWMEAVIADDTITVNWVSDNGDTTSIYWVGTYTAPTEYSADYTWTSDRNKEQTDNAMLASTDDTKDFSYSDADKELSYQVSMAGTTTKVKLTKLNKKEIATRWHTYCPRIERQLSHPCGLKEMPELSPGWTNFQSNWLYFNHTLL